VALLASWERSKEFGVRTDLTTAPLAGEPESEVRWQSELHTHALHFMLHGAEGKRLGLTLLDLVQDCRHASSATAPPRLPHRT
jgi:hypothetical protein